MVKKVLLKDGKIAYLSQDKPIISHLSESSMPMSRNQDEDDVLNKSSITVKTMGGFNLTKLTDSEIEDNFLILLNNVSEVVNGDLAYSNDAGENYRKIISRINILSHMISIEGWDRANHILMNNKTFRKSNLDTQPSNLNGVFLNDKVDDDIIYVYYSEENYPGIFCVHDGDGNSEVSIVGDITKSYKKIVLV